MDLTRWRELRWQALSEKLTASGRRWWRWGAAGVLVLLAFVEGVPWMVAALTTVSTLSLIHI